MKKLLLSVLVMFLIPVAYGQEWHWKCDRSPISGQRINCVKAPGKDPELTITEEDMKGMVYVTPAQERAFKKKQFEQALENEITARMYQDRVPTREQAIQDILAGVPRKVR